MMNQMAAQKQEQDKNDALLQAYIGMQQAGVDQKVEPYRQNNEFAQQGAAQAQAAQTGIGLANQADPAAVQQFTTDATGNKVPVTPEMQQQWAQKAQQGVASKEQGASSAADLLTQAREKYTPKTLGLAASMVGKPGMDSTKLIAMLEVMDQKHRQQDQETLNKTAFTKAFSEKGIDDRTRVNMLLQEGVSPDHPILKALIDSSGKQTRGVMAPNGTLIDPTTGAPISAIGQYAAPAKTEKPGVTYGPVQIDSNGTAFQLGSNGLILPRPEYNKIPKATKDTALKDLSDAEEREVKDHTAMKPGGSYPDKKEMDAWAAGLKGIRDKYSQQRNALKQPPTTTPTGVTGKVDPNNLTPDQMSVAKSMKAAGYTMEQIIAALNDPGTN
jgi:hypothetical protein